MELAGLSWLMSAPLPSHGHARHRRLIAVGAAGAVLAAGAGVRGQSRQ